MCSSGKEKGEDKIKTKEMENSKTSICTVCIIQFMQSVKFNYTFAYVYDHTRDVLDYDHSYELNTISSKLR